MAANFPATGTSSLVGTPSDLFNASLKLAVDNSSKASQGLIYVADAGQKIAIYNSDGTFICEVPSSALGFAPDDVAVDLLGQPWVLSAFGQGGVLKRYGNAGCPPSNNASCLLNPQGDGAVEVDGSGNLYVRTGGGTIEKFAGGNCNSVPSSLDPGGAWDVYADQSDPGGHIFTIHSESFNEYDSSGALIGTFGTGGAIDDSQGGIAYSPYDPPGPEGPHVYVSDEGLHVVDVLGPVVTGTVPDPTIGASDGIGVGKATFHGMINPQGVANAYYFEWTRSKNEWFDVSRSPLQSLPEDSSDHAVSFTSKALRGNTSYRVRVVTVNTENGPAKGLHSASAVDGFKTLQATEPPVATIDLVEKEPVAPCTTGIAADSACVSGTINPREDTVDWRVQRSTDPKCENGFVNESVQVLPGEERNEPVPVSFVMKGLLPYQHYCVRIVAANSFGSTTSEVKEFTTKAIPPDEVSTAFAAPRLDTSARLNARVNPHGAPLTYSFEYSEDGVNWTEVLPDEHYTDSAREVIVVGQEIAGLQPSTTYHYRLAALENEAGLALSLGEEKTFTTRTAAEVASPSSCPNEAARAAQHAAYLGECRGIELVNSPDKGDQHVRTLIHQGTSPMSPDGNRVVWNVFAGAPGGNVGSGATFVAERTAPTQAAPNGWQSRALIPTAEQQPAGASTGSWNLGATTSDLSVFAFNAGGPALPTKDGWGKTLVAYDANQVQLAAAQYARPFWPQRVDLADGGRGIFFVDRDSPHQLEDVGTVPPETISLIPNGDSSCVGPACKPSKCELDVSQENQSFVGGGNNAAAAGAQWRPGYHMIATADASRAYFQAKPNKPNGACDFSGLYGIYERNREARETTLIDPGTAGVSPEFIRTTPDGRSAYFATQSSLDPADTAEDANGGPDPNPDPDVYRWDEEGGTSSCLTCVVPDADVKLDRRAVLVSDDFSHLYFRSTRQLLDGEGRGGDVNLYALSKVGLRFVADLDTVPSGGSVEPAQLSADGNVLVFPAGGDRVSGQGLTADQIASQCGLIFCNELFRYEERDGSLECLSCRRGNLTDESVEAGGTLAGGGDFEASSDGETVAFVTAERLLPADVNGTSDVYEWRHGVLRLVSDGVTTYPQSNTTAPQVHAVSADGSDILFSLVDPGLTGFEQDGFANLYDARIDGGFPVPNPPAHCSEESCQGPLQAAPPANQPDSLAFEGAGNVERPHTRSCHKGKVRRHGHCVKRPRHTRHKRRSGRGRSRTHDLPPIIIYFRRCKKRRRRPDQTSEGEAQ